MKKETLRKRCEVISDYLKRRTSFVDVDTIAIDVKMTKEQVRASMVLARRKLGAQGIILINKLGSGYRVGSLEEFKSEVDKSCKRSLSHMSSMANLCTALLASPNGKELESGLKELVKLIHSNLKAIDVLFEPPEAPDYWEFGSHEEYQEAKDEYLAERDDPMLKITPDFIEKIPHELVRDPKDNQ